MLRSTFNSKLVSVFETIAIFISFCRLKTCRSVQLFKEVIYYKCYSLSYTNIEKGNQSVSDTAGIEIIKADRSFSLFSYARILGHF